MFIYKKMIEKILKIYTTSLTITTTNDGIYDEED